MNGSATVPFATACALIGGTRQWGAKARRDGTYPLPVIEIGDRKWRVPRAPLRVLLGVDDDELDRLLAEVGDAR